MNNHQRAETFALYVALELKGKITSRGYTAKQVAHMVGRPAATMNRWLNGKLALPISVLGAASEAIGVDPDQIVEDAYSRLCVEFGEADGTTYEPEPTNVTPLNVPTSVDDLEAKRPRTLDKDKIAAHTAEPSEHNLPAPGEDPRDI